MTFDFQYLHGTTINLLLVMVLIWTTGIIFKKIKQPLVLGELLAGIIFGPPILGIIEFDSTVKVLSELGVFFLMFYAGIETSPSALKQMTKPSLIVGIGGFLLPFILGVFVSVWIFDINYITGLFIGLGLSITAIAVNVRLLSDMNLNSYRVTPLIIGASVVDDVISFTVFSVIVGMTAGMAQEIWFRLSFDLLKVSIFFGVSIFIGLKVLPIVSSYFLSREAKGFTFSLIVALLFGFLAELAGLHIIIGAYLAGLFVRHNIVNPNLFQKINDRFLSISYGFLGPIFFVSLSFHMTFNIFQTHLIYIIVLLVAAILGKVVGAGISAYLAKMTFNESMVVGLSMNGRGAVELIIASVGLELGLIDDSFFSILVVIAFLTTVFAPISLSVYIWRIKNKGLIKYNR